MSVAIFQILMTFPAAPASYKYMFGREFETKYLYSCKVFFDVMVFFRHCNFFLIIDFFVFYRNSLREKPTGRCRS